MTTIRSTDSSGNLITAAEGDENGKLEFDPQGNNVGFTDWWALSTQGTPDPTSGVEFPPFETIRNGQLVRYNADGIDVPPNFFFELSQFTFGGMFGLLEHQSRMSVPGGTRLLRNYVFSDDDGYMPFDLDDRGIQEAYDYAKEAINPTWVTVRIHVETNWALNSSWLPGSSQEDFADVDPPKETGDSIRDFLQMLSFADKMARLTDAKLKMVGLTDDERSKLLNALAYMLVSSDCVAAFRRAGIRTPAETLRDQGAVWAKFSLLGDPANNASLGITENERITIRDGASLYSQGTTVFEIPGKPVYTFWTVTSFRDGTYPFEEVVVHEIIHESRVGKHPYLPLGFFGIPLTGGHDLTGYEHYNDILENCRLPREDGNE